jgi:small subunit ribosomal protein S8
MMTDPIADMLTRMRNAIAIERTHVDIPFSKIKISIAEVLKREGYIWDYQTVESTPGNILRIDLKYGPNGERVIQHLERVSKPGRRVYTPSDKIPKILQGLGITILSTSQGMLSGREAKVKKIGGEIICKLY